MQASVRRRIALGVLAAAIVGLAATSSAQTAPKHTTATVAPSTSVRHAAPISYNSGVGPTLSANPAKVTMELKPHGIRVYHLNGQGMQTLSAHIGADGKLVLRCNNKIEQALKQPGKQGDPP